MISFLMVIGGLVVGAGIAARNNGYKGIFSREGKDLREEETKAFSNVEKMISLSLKQASKE